MASRYVHMSQPGLHLCFDFNPNSSCFLFQFHTAFSAENAAAPQPLRCAGARQGATSSTSAVCIARSRAASRSRKPGQVSPVDCWCAGV